MSMLYLDNAATTPVRPEVLEAMMPYLTQWFGNPSSHHTVGEAAAGALAEARARVARVLGMRASDVVFTSGGTEANNLAVKGIGIGAWQASGRRHVVTTPIEHESILESAAYLARVHGFEVTHLAVDRFARVDPDAAAAALREDTALLSLGYANNEVGTIQDVAAIAAVARERGVPVHIDAVQAAGWLPLSAAELGVDAISLAGHKVGAPKGTGVLAVRGRLPLEILLLRIPARPPRKDAADIQVLAQDVPHHVAWADAFGRAVVVGAAGGVDVVIAGEPTALEGMNPADEPHRLAMTLDAIWDGDGLLERQILGAAGHLDRVLAGGQRD